MPDTYGLQTSIRRAKADKAKRRAKQKARPPSGKPAGKVHTGASHILEGRG